MTYRYFIPIMLHPPASQRFWRVEDGEKVPRLFYIGNGNVWRDRPALNSTVNLMKRLDTGSVIECTVPPYNWPDLPK